MGVLVLSTPFFVRGEYDMGITTVYLDAGYIDKVLHYDHANARLDFAKLAGEMAKPDQLLRAYYYHAALEEKNGNAIDDHK